MKRFIALLLALIMVLSLAACGEKKEENNDAPANTPAASPEASPEAPSEEPKKEPETFGEEVYFLFEDAIAATPDATAQELADAIVNSGALPFAGATMPVEAGLLSGFGNTEIKGFEEGVMFAPMIGSIAFVGYIFKLADGADIDGFMKTLEDNADPRWNICVTAEETIVEKNGNTVFFLMSPTQKEQ